MVRTLTRSSHSTETLSHLAAVVLLSGSLRASGLGRLPRSLLDLPLDERTTVLTAWRHQAADLAGALGRTVPVRLLVDQSGALPAADASDEGAFSIERDPLAYRGTGGVLRDIAEHYDDGSYLLVLSAAQLLLEPLSALARQLADVGGDVSLVAHDDATPSGVTLLRCEVLRGVAAQGFVDLKEQALPQMAGRFMVRTLRRRTATGLPLRTLREYVAALRTYHARRRGQDGPPDPFAEQWRPTFAVIEPGAVVETGARVHDSVVLAGARVERDAVLVRSLVLPEARVERGRMLVDELVRSGGRGGT